MWSVFKHTILQCPSFTTGQHNMIAKTIEKTTQTLNERGIPNGSFWTVVFEDGSRLTENNSNWSTFSEKKIVNFLGQKKMVNICKFKVKTLECCHEGLQAYLSVPEDCQVYQAIRSEALILPNVMRRDSIVGRIIGIVKGDEVIQEYYLNSLEYKVEGFKK